MKGLGQEFKVGLFMLLGLVAFFFMTFKVGVVSFTTGDAERQFHVYFGNISGVVEKSHVKMAGVRIGEVISIRLENNRAKVTVNLDEGIEIPDDSVATVRSAGLLGEKYIDIRPGSSTVMIRSGQTLGKSVDPSDIDEMVGKLSAALDDIKQVTSSLKESFGTEEGKEGLKSIIRNFSEVGENLNKLVSDNTEKLDSIIDNVDKASALLRSMLTENQKALNSTLTSFDTLASLLSEKAPDLIKHLDAAAVGIKDIVSENRKDIKEGITNARELTGNLNDVVKVNRENFRKVLENLKKSSEKLDSVMDSVKQVSAKVEKGEGTLGKLVQEDKIYDSLSATLDSAQGFLGKVDDIKIGVGARVERQFKQEKNRSYFALKIQPREDKYYLIEITEDTRVPETDGRNTLTSLLYTFEIAKRYGDVTLKGGLVESSGAVGVDYHAFRDRLWLSADLFNFSGYDSNAGNPQLKLTARYYPQKYVYLYIGGDELLNDYYRTFIAGAGLMADENDIKFLFGLFK